MDQWLGNQHGDGTEKNVQGGMEFQGAVVVDERKWAGMFGCLMTSIGHVHTKNTKQRIFTRITGLPTYLPEGGRGKDKRADWEGNDWLCHLGFDNDLLVCNDLTITFFC